MDRRIEAADQSNARIELARELGRCAGLAFVCFYGSSFIVLLAATFTYLFVPLHREHPGSSTRVDLLSAFAAWDGEWYVRIASEGYSYDPERMSSVAFYPAYPLLGGALKKVTGMRPEMALLLVSHAFLFASLVLLAAYLKARPTRCAGIVPDQLTNWTLWSLALFPTSLYFRMTYTESLFLFLIILAMYGMQRHWPTVLIALIIGLATATRAVGVALVMPFLLHLWNTSPSKRSFVLRGALLLPLCGWGLLAYMAYQQYAFDDPMAFVKTQVHWRERASAADPLEQAGALMTLQPLRDVYDPSCECYWANDPPGETFLFNLSFANPIYFLLAVGLVVLGGWRGWLTRGEWMLSAGLLLIPYVLQSYRTCMASQARYAVIVFPAFIVVGHLLSRAGAPMATGILAISAVVLAGYTALFVSWYWFY